MRAWYRERPLLLAALALAAASIVATWTVARATAAAPTDRVTRAAAGVAMPAIGESDTLPVSLIARTVDRDPFHPERRRPTTPFRLPAEQAAAQAVAAAPAPVAPIRLLGTVITPGQDAFAMSQLGDEPPRVVRVGGSLGGFTLRRIEPGRAVFSTPNGETMDLRVAKAGP